ncbi:DUF4352 domain-containing protein [Mycobacterium sp. 236(2023)]|uniref:DUF4352 domain-containing protein n=1 Tax=Mycobacterium sp. 236(2023) TaxID=3038163 RepID=UPI00241539CC|nr:DUF4352 domain-containing protein [Mycobacterium sp. 236(2023)]MDG4667997.1 DUF4352 domain-containing protein [Mycobacterium sp. 236(2023)]
MSAAGWYPDPSGNGGQRYFNGTEWTEYRRAPGAPPPKKSNTGKVLLFSLLGVVLFFGGCGTLLVIGSSGDSKKDREMSSSTPSSYGVPAEVAPTQAAPVITPAGSTARDGKFEFKILGVTSAKTVSDPTGNPYMTTDAQGVFVVVKLQITNIGDRPQNFFGQNQKLFDTAGRQYDPDTRADMYMNVGESIMGDINPGNSITREVAFDVPPDSRLTYLQLHDSMLSGGVKMALPAS